MDAYTCAKCGAVAHIINGTVVRSCKCNGRIYANLSLSTPLQRPSSKRN